jgi:HEAT repeat protein
MRLRLAGSVLLLLALVGNAFAERRAPGRRPGKTGKTSKTKERPGSRSTENSEGSITYTPREIGGKTLKNWELELTHADPSRRAAALIILPRFGDAASRAIPLVIRRCGDKDTSPRVKAVIILRHIQVDPSDVPAVVKVLAKHLVYPESQSIVKYEAVVSLSRFAKDAQSAIPALIQATQDRSSWEIRHGAISVLWRAAQANTKGAENKVYTALLAALRDPARQVRLEAIHGLGGCGRPVNPHTAKQVIGALNGLIAAGSKVQAIWAYASLVHIYGTTDTKLGDKQIRYLARFLSKAKYSKSPEARINAAQALGALGKRSKIVLSSLLAMLKEDDAAIVHAACGSLAALNDTSEAVIDALIGLLGHKDPNINYSGCLALVTLKAGQKRVLTALDKQLERKGLKPETARLFKETIAELKKPKKE